MTNGNPVYSLSGAKYDVYRSNDDGYVLTLTTNASGYASASGLPYGSYYCVESQPPTGFFKDTSRHYFDVSGNAVIRVSDVPYDDPVGALLHKADPLTGGTAQGGGTLGGAEFTVKYYAGYYSSDPAAQGISLCARGLCVRILTVSAILTHRMWYPATRFILALLAHRRFL